MKRFPAKEYDLPFFHKEGFVRKLCPKCDKYFWTQNSDREICGEATLEGCEIYTFLDDPPTRKPYSLREMREAFLSFFEKHDHARIKPYPVVARWRDDLYLTHASIIDFQPYVTNGLAPAPANPLVISQPCIRLTDVDNTGPTFGRHMTFFEMGGAHAFNYPDKEVYWKDQTVRYQHEWVTKDLGVKSEEITYKEEMWSGGGNAGPCVESVIRGLEVDTLVFLQYKVANGELVKLPIRTVDTGYGIDRYSWLSQGVASGFHAVYGKLLNEIFKMAKLEKIDNNLLTKIAKFSGFVSVDKAASKLATRKKIARLVGMKWSELDDFLTPIENVFAVADHTKCLSFLLSEGVVPSNIQEGYLARLLFRRVYRLLRMLDIPDKLYVIMDRQIDMWSVDFPRLKEMHNEILEMLQVEEEKFEETIKRGEGMVKRISSELKSKRKKKIPVGTLTELYDSHGLPPEIVKNVAEEEKMKVEIPDNFYTLIAERHAGSSKPEREEAKPDEGLESKVSNLPPTELLYNKNQYLKTFEATVLKVIDGKSVVLDKTCFYPEGGGQPADDGYLKFNGKSAEVVDVQKVGRVVLHKLKGDIPRKGAAVKGRIDWNKRFSLMKHHTATHLVNGAARRVLGQHVWQSGTQKGVETSRLDISHYSRLSLEELHKIEILANKAILRNINVETSLMPRGKAESQYGFRLYQGGAVPGKEIRVVKIGDWDIEACAGTHLKNTGEVGLIKIVHSERVQDGVERLVYSTGIQAVKAVQRNDKLLSKLSEILSGPVEKLDKTAEKLVRQLKEANVEKRRLIKELATRESTGIGSVSAEVSEEVNGIKIVVRDFQSSINVDRMVQTANEIIKRNDAAVTIFYGSDGKNARIMVMVGRAAVKKGVSAGEVVREVSPIIGGGGGGKSNFAQGGGTLTERLPEAISKARRIIRNKLKKH